MHCLVLYTFSISKSLSTSKLNAGSSKEAFDIIHLGKL